MLNVKIITPRGAYRNTKAKIINIVTTDGQRGILPNHMPIVTMLEISVMSIEEENGRRFYTIGGGMFYLDASNNATILVDSIENVKDIDVERAERAKVRATKMLNSKLSEQEMIQAEVHLKRALNRLGAVKNIK